jgi:hypothetical protein
MFVIYKCSCMPDEVTIFAQDRKEDEEVVHWVEQVLGRAIGMDHCHRSPLCAQRTMDYVKIPIDQGDGARIGNLRRN